MLVLRWYQQEDFHICDVGPYRHGRGGTAQSLRMVNRYIILPSCSSHNHEGYTRIKRHDPRGPAEYMGIESS